MIKLPKTSKFPIEIQIERARIQALNLAIYKSQCKKIDLEKEFKQKQNYELEQEIRQRVEREMQERELEKQNKQKQELQKQKKQEQELEKQKKQETDEISNAKRKHKLLHYNCMYALLKKVMLKKNIAVKYDNIRKEQIHYLEKINKIQTKQLLNKK